MIIETPNVSPLFFCTFSPICAIVYGKSVPNHIFFDVILSVKNIVYHVSCFSSNLCFWKNKLTTGMVNGTGSVRGDVIHGVGQKVFDGVGEENFWRSGTSRRGICAGYKGQHGVSVSIGECGVVRLAINLVGISPKGTGSPATRHPPLATRHSPPATRNLFLKEGTPQNFQKKNWKNYITFCLFLVYDSTNSKWF